MPVNPQVLKDRRDKLGLSQREVAARAGMIQQAYARIESGDRINPNFSTVEKLADALGITLDELRAKPEKKVKRKRASK